MLFGKYMKIKSINASYSSRKVNIQDVEFNKGLTLLVGASGVGKTQILDAICDIKTVALGESINGFSWQIEFSIDEHDYLWSGEFNGVEEDALARVQGLFSKSKSRSNSNARIKTEQLYIDSDLIIHREEEQIIFKGSPTLKLAPNESCIKLLQQENLITPIFESFKKVKLIASQDETPFANIAVGLNNQEFNSFNELRALTSHVLEKAYLCQNNFEDKFEDICEAYKEIFPFIKNIEIMQTELNIPNSDGKKLYQYMYRILEDGVEDWIYQEQISSGMKKVFLQLCYLLLSPPQSIFLIDEFENGFGVNCIDAISEWLLKPNMKYQFIITSHHPYIINHIPSKRWKIVSRNKNIIQAYEADRFLDESNHESFIKLINLPIYKLGASTNIDN